jgi:hypothetical protein
VLAVGIDDDFAASLRPGDTVDVPVAPGLHLLWVRWQKHYVGCTAFEARDYASLSVVVSMGSEVRELLAQFFVAVAVGIIFRSTTVGYQTLPVVFHFEDGRALDVAEARLPTHTPARG